MIIHVLNLTALLTLGVIIFLSSVVRLWHLAILSPILILIIFYWFARANQNITLGYFALSVSIAAWIIICENIVMIDNIFGTRITRNLRLGMELQSRADANIRGRGNLLQKCCNDLLSYNRKPGSKHQMTYDCDTCNDPYEVIVDETGYLNRQRGLWRASTQVDLFLAGDSVMQGFGTPSALDLARERMPVQM
jgi:hypothetical protein